MDKFKEIKYEIKKLSECLYCLEKAYKCLVDVDDTDQVYEEIHKKETIYGIIIGIILLVVINIL